MNQDLALQLLSLYRKPVDISEFCNAYREVTGLGDENNTLITLFSNISDVIIEQHTFFIPDLVVAEVYLLKLAKRPALIDRLLQKVFTKNHHSEITFNHPFSIARLCNLITPRIGFTPENEKDIRDYYRFVLEQIKQKQLDYRAAPQIVSHLFANILYHDMIIDWKPVKELMKEFETYDTYWNHFLKSDHSYLYGYYFFFLGSFDAVENFVELAYPVKRAKAERLTFQALLHLEQDDIKTGLKETRTALTSFKRKFGNDYPQIFRVALDLFTLYALKDGYSNNKSLINLWYKLDGQYVDEKSAPLLSLYTKERETHTILPNEYEYHTGYLVGVVDAITYSMLVSEDLWDQEKFEAIAKKAFEANYHWIAYHYYNILDQKGLLSQKHEENFNQIKQEGRSFLKLIKPVLNQQIQKEKNHIFDLIQSEINHQNSQNSQTDQHDQRIIWLTTENQYYATTLTPYIQQRKNGSWSRGRKVKTYNLKYDYNHLLTSQEKQIIQHGAEYDDSIEIPYIFELLPGMNNIYYEVDRQPVLFEEIRYPVYLYDQKNGYDLVVPELPLENDNLSWRNLIQKNSYHYQVILLEQHTITLLQELMKQKVIIPNTPEGEQLLNNWITQNQTLELKAPFFLPPDVTPVDIKTDPGVVVEIEWYNDQFTITLKVSPALGWPPYFPEEKGLTRVREVNGNYERLKRIKSREKKIMNHFFDLSGLKSNKGSQIIKNYSVVRLLIDMAATYHWLTISWLNSKKQIKQVDPKQFKWKLTEKNHWFQLSGTLDLSIDEQLEITNLLGKIDQKGFITLDNGDLLMIDQQLQKELKKLKKMAITENDQLLIPPILSDRVEQLAFLKRVKRTPQWTQQIETLRKLNKQKIDLPKEIKEPLWSYQKKGVQWITKTTGCGFGACLADDMGLGKTVQAISAIRLNPGAALIITPASVLYNWRNEINRFAPVIDVKLYEGVDREILLNNIDHDTAIIVSYDTFQRDSEYFLKENWSWVILDEAQMIKNDTTKRSKAIFKLKGERRIALSGTPIENHLGELWSLFHFLNPQLLGTKKEFNQRFVKPISKGDQTKQSILKKILIPFLMRRIKKKVLKELPDKTEKIHWITYSGQEKTYYETLRRNALKATKGIQNSDDHGGSKRIQILTHLLKLRQATCDISLLGKTIEESEKTKKAIDLIKQIMESNHKTLVFSQFTSYLARIKEALEKRKIPYLSLDGSTTKQNRQRLVDQFQTDNTPVFLISLKSGGTGLNLTSANYVIHLDPWWNPAVEDQATDRTHRIGQSDHVTVYKLIVKNSIEEKILALHKQKRNLSSSILDQMDQKTSLSLDQLVELLQ